MRSRLIALAALVGLVLHHPEVHPEDSGAAYRPHVLTTVYSAEITGGYIMDTTIHGDVAYTVVQNADYGQDRIMLHRLPGGEEIDSWDIGTSYAAGIDSSSRGLHVMSRRGDFLRTYSFSGELLESRDVRLPPGIPYGFTLAGEKAYFASYLGPSEDLPLRDESVIYSVDLTTGAVGPGPRFDGRIFALEWVAGRLYSYREAFDVYADYWLEIIDTRSGAQETMRFFNGRSWGLDSVGDDLFAMQRTSEGFLLFGFSVEPDRRRISGRYYNRDVTVTFPFENGNDNPYSLDLYLPLISDPDVQLVESVSFSPEPDGVIVDHYGNEFRTIPLSGTGSSEVTMSLKASVPDYAYTIDTDYVFDGADVPPAILSEYTRETASFDYSHPQISNALSGLDLSGSYIQNLLAIRDRVNDLLRVVGPSGPETKASDFLSQGIGRCYAHTLSFGALARAVGYPVRVTTGIHIATSHAEDDPWVHAWAEFYMPGVGWVPLDTVLDDDPDGDHTHRWVGYRPGRSLYVFAGAFEEFDFRSFLLHRNMISSYIWSSQDRANRARVSRGIMRVEVALTHPRPPQEVAAQ